MNLLVKFCLFLILFLFVQNSDTHSQISTTKWWGSASILPDSLFVNFEYPKIPEEFYKFYKYGDLSTFTVMCYMSVDTSGLISNMNLYPIYSRGNDLPRKHYLWKKLLNNIKKASKLWKAKRLYWLIDSTKDRGLNDIFVRANSGLENREFRPSRGKQFHLMILEFIPQPNHHEDCDFVYKIRVEP